MVSDWHAKYMTPLSAGLLDAGCDVCLLTRDHDVEFGGETREPIGPGTMARQVRDSLGGRAPHLQLPGRVRDPRALRPAIKLARSVSRFGPDVVHLQDTSAQDVRLPLIAHVRSGRLAVTSHDVVHTRATGREDARRVLSAGS